MCRSGASTEYIGVGPAALTEKQSPGLHGRASSAGALLGNASGSAPLRSTGETAQGGARERNSLQTTDARATARARQSPQRVWLG